MSDGEEEKKKSWRRMPGEKDVSCAEEFETQGPFPFPLCRSRLGGRPGLCQSCKARERLPNATATAQSRGRQPMALQGRSRLAQLMLCETGQHSKSCLCPSFFWPVEFRTLSVRVRRMYGVQSLCAYFLKTRDSQRSLRRSRKQYKATADCLGSPLLSLAIETRLDRVNFR